MELDQLQHQVDAGTQLRAEQGDRREADTTRSPGPGGVPAVGAGRVRNNVGPPPQRPVQAPHVIR